MLPGKAVFLAERLPCLVCSLHARSTSCNNNMGETCARALSQPGVNQAVVMLLRALSSYVAFAQPMILPVKHWSNERDRVGL